MSWAELVTGYLEHLRARGRALRTREQALLVLRRFEASCAGREPNAVRLEDLAAWRTALRAAGCSEWTAADYLMRVRGLFRWAWRAGTCCATRAASSSWAGSPGACRRC